MPAVYEKPHTVVAAEADELGHVNNQVYLGWFLEAAIAHSAAQGWSLPDYLKVGGAWVVRRHELDYLASARPGDELMVRSWVATMGETSSLRRYEVVRLRDRKVITEGSTLWVWVNLRTGRHERVPSDIAGAFTVLADRPAA